MRKIKKENRFLVNGFATRDADEIFELVQVFVRQRFGQSRADFLAEVRDAHDEDGMFIVNFDGMSDDDVSARLLMIDQLRESSVRIVYGREWHECFILNPFRTCRDGESRLKWQEVFMPEAIRRHA